VVGSLVAVGVLVLVVAGRWGQFASAPAGAPWWALTAAAALRTASLLSRTKAWNVCVRAAGAYTAPPASATSATSPTANSGSPRRLRRFGVPHRETPKAVVLATTEIPIVLMELSLATLFSFTLVHPWARRGGRRSSGSARSSPSSAASPG
jgi:hypothetical protein